MVEKTGALLQVLLYIAYNQKKSIIIATILFRGLLGQSEIKANGSTGEECRGSTTHCSSASAGNDYDAEISDIYDETWLESTVIVNEHRSNGADEHKEPKPSKIYKYVTNIII